ncbi:uncharacterized protein [Typha latifolia]|uniref:uncharacterized protein isoform X1 n=1 Tax=Typha latifolia TaxID=4733 RepID=UPI003C2B1429
MDGNVRRLLNRISLTFATLATIALFHLFLHSSSYCSPPISSPSHPNHRSQTLTLAPFPKSSCDASSRSFLSPEKRFSKLRSSAPYRRRVDSFSSAVFLPLRLISLLSNSSRVLCVFAGAGHEVAALQESGVVDVTGVDLVDFPPLVKRADPHNLPFFDRVFDLGFSTGVEAALFPARFAAEMERTVRRGGVVVVAVQRQFQAEGIKALFKRSSVLEVRNVTLEGSEMSLIIMRNNGKNPP